ncbi:MAG: phytanoyl-CoA dioxygenase [Methylomarinum sp.]|nr:phytanoyl-CoA dioxygenase [Methylomarinum sp.]
MLSFEQKKELSENGFILLKNFYDLAEEIEPIQFGIWQIIGVLLKKYKCPVQQKIFTPDTFDDGYLDLIKKDRKYGGEVYDAVKQIPAFLRLVSAKKNEDLFFEMRNTNCAGIAGRGFGVRIDNPNEQKYRSLWHYEYRDQLRSIDGVVFWTPLVSVTSKLGPVQVCPKSHLGPLRRSYLYDTTNQNKSGAYAMRLENEQQLIKKYGIVAPLSEPGDLIIMDFLTLHSSGENFANRARWSMQFRLFNFLDPAGQKINWVGGVADGVSLSSVHPELVIGNSSNNMEEKC